MKILLALLLVFCETGFSQPMRSFDERPGFGRGRPDFVMFEAVNLASEDSLQARIDIHYRINTDFFIPVRNTDPSFQWEFARHGEILIELIDSSEFSRARESNRIEVGSATTDQDPKSQNWYQGMVSFKVLPGPYKLVVEVTDLESDRKFLDRNVTVRARSFGSLPLEASTPLIVRADDSTAITHTLTPLNFGGDLPFGERSALYIELISNQSLSTPVRLSYSLATSPGPDETSVVLLKDTLSQIQIIPGATLLQRKQEDTIIYSIESRPLRNVAGFVIPLESQKLPLRAFELDMTVYAGTLRTAIKKKIRMVWPEMPFSLRNVDLALDALRYIATEDQLDSLKRGSFINKRENLESFWKTKDPTPETAYNELMVQYYQRVDHAMKEFGTLREPDGSKSDRGRIYILYGQPTRTDRTLGATTGFQEIWTYEALNKKFIFMDTGKSGNYVLVSTQNL